jgi:hypothetical protein
MLAAVPFATEHEFAAHVAAASAEENMQILPAANKKALTFLRNFVVFKAFSKLQLFNSGQSN